MENKQQIIEAVIKELNDKHAPKWYELWENQINSIWETNSHKQIKDFIRSLQHVSMALENCIESLNKLEKRVFDLENSGWRRLLFWRKYKQIKYTWPLPLTEETQDIYYRDMIKGIKNLNQVLDKLAKDQDKK